MMSFHFFFYIFHIVRAHVCFTMHSFDWIEVCPQMPIQAQLSCCDSNTQFDEVKQCPSASNYVYSLSVIQMSLEAALIWHIENLLSAKLSAKLAFLFSFPLMHTAA